MGRTLVRRLVSSALVLWGGATLTFAMLRVVPGGPFDREKKLPPEIVANLSAKYHLDEPVGRQYVRFLADLARGDLGPSYKYVGRSVNDILHDTFPVSAALGSAALLLSVGIGLPLGFWAGLKKGSAWDALATATATLGISVPRFVLGVVLLLVFAVGLGWFPPALWEGPRYWVLPAVTLALAPGAYLARLTRMGVVDALGAEYVRAAEARGLPRRRILLRHVLPNALTSVVTILGPLTAGLLTGSFVVEFIFSIPGMGRFWVTAVTNRDYPLVMGVTLVYTLLLTLSYLVVDVLYGLLDPRMRRALGGGGS